MDQLLTVTITWSFRPRPSGSPANYILFLSKLFPLISHFYRGLPWNCQLHNTNNPLCFWPQHKLWSLISASYLPVCPYTCLKVACFLTLLLSQTNKIPSFAFCIYWVYLWALTLKGCCSIFDCVAVYCPWGRLILYPERLCKSEASPWTFVYKLII